MCLLSITNLDFAGVGVSNDGEGLLREINGSSASGRTVVDNFNDNAGSLARFRDTLVSGSDACHSVTSSTSCSVAPNGIACCSYHHSIILVSVA